MAEIRQIQVDGVNYDLVISEDEVSATRAEQAAQRATQQATYASNYAIQAGNAVTNAEEYAQDAQDAADRAEAIVGGQFVSYGQSQSLTDSEKETARTNIGASPGNNPNLVKNGWFRINSKNKYTYSPGSGSTLDCWRFGGQNDTDTITVLADGIQVVGSGETRVYQDYSSGFQAVETGKTYTLSVLVTELNGTCQAVWHAGEYFNLSIGLNTYTGVATSEMKAVYACINLNGTIKISAVKLEVGTVSTLMNDVASDDNLEAIRCNYSMHSNPNLLDNAYFVGGGSQLGDGVFPINQRGQTSYTGNTYTIDRWIIASSAITVTLNAGYLELSGTAGNNFSQVIDPNLAKALYGKTVTVSALMDDGTILTGTGIFPTRPASGWNFVNFVYGTDAALIIGTSELYRSEFFIQTQSASAKVCAVKLELGSVSTLANDAPPNFGEELRKCKRRLRYIPLTRTPAVIAGSAAVVTLNGIEMASVPTPALISAGGARDAGGMQSITSATVTGFTYNTPTVQFALAGNLNYVIGYVYDTIIQLSCEL